MKKYICVNWKFIKYLILLFFSSGILAVEDTNQFSGSFGGYLKNYTNDYLYTVEGEFGRVPLAKEVDFGLNLTYLKRFTNYFSVDTAFDFSPNQNKIKASTCKDKLTNKPIDCEISLNSNFVSISLLGTFRYLINEYFVFYLGAGFSFNYLRQEISVKAKGYKGESLESANTSAKRNLAFKLGGSYKKYFMEYKYLGDTNESKTSILGVSSILIGFYF